jgi:amino acid transporter
MVLSAAWSAALGLGIERLVELDVILYGLALMLEFASLVVLRRREPRLARPFRVPGGLPVAVSLGLGPAALLALAVVHGRRPDRLNAMLLALGLAAAGPALYFLMKRLERVTEAAPSTADHRDRSVG